MSIKSIDDDLVFSIPNREEVYVCYFHYSRSAIRRKRHVVYFGISAMQFFIVLLSLHYE